MSSQLNVGEASVADSNVLKVSTVLKNVGFSVSPHGKIFTWVAHICCVPIVVQVSLLISRFVAANVKR
jgi:hypothetical protein